MPTKGVDHILLWDGATLPSDFGSPVISQIIEENDFELRAKYLHWVYELGEVKKGQHRLIDALELAPGVSFWWMTLIAEKCNFAKSKNIALVIKLLALSLHIQNLGATCIQVATKDATLKKFIKKVCACNNIAYEDVGPVDSVRRTSFFFQKNTSWVYIKSLVWFFRYLVDHWALKDVGVKGWRESRSKTTFVSYLLNFSERDLRAGHYISNYWGTLPEMLSKVKHKTDWLHLYVKSPKIPSARNASILIKVLNISNKDNEVHVTIDGFISFKVIFQTLSRWIWLIYMGLIWRREIAEVKCEGMNLWELLEGDWNCSMGGVDGISSLFNFYLFQAALEAKCTQDIGVYLMENQPWEMALINAWRKFDHKKLIGVAHSWVRFWDLRYFSDHRVWDDVDQKLSKCPIPMPDSVAINGPLARNEFMTSGFPESRLEEVEALRYQTLDRNELKKQVNRNVTILALGDYLPENTNRLISSLEVAIKELNYKVTVLYKPHPYCLEPLNKNVKIRQVEDGLLMNDILKECDIVIASEVTAAAIDAYYVGIPVITILNLKTLNMSPLRGLNNAFFASNGSELKRIINTVLSEKNNDFREERFWSDPNLVRWMKCISN